MDREEAVALEGLIDSIRQDSNSEKNITQRKYKSKIIYVAEAIVFCGILISSCNSHSYTQKRIYQPPINQTATQDYSLH